MLILCLDAFSPLLLQADVWLEPGDGPILQRRWLLVPVLLGQPALRDREANMGSRRIFPKAVSQLKGM